jgi:hypothetical protein
MAARFSLSLDGMDSGFNLAVGGRRLTWLTGFTVPTTLLVFFLTFGDTGFSTDFVAVPVIHLRGLTLTYYRPPSGSQTRESRMDLYDSFQKDANGRLLLRPTGKNSFSRTTDTFFVGYMLQTRRGNPIQILQGLPSRERADQSNCHGYTFLNGEYWMYGSQVEQILDDNGWQPVTEPSVIPGDIAVYRASNGRVCHSARVVDRDANGHILVNSKNGFEPLRERVPAIIVLFTNASA